MFLKHFYSSAAIMSEFSVWILCAILCYSAPQKISVVLGGSEEASKLDTLLRTSLIYSHPIKVL